EIAEEVFGFSHPEVEVMRQQAEEEVKQIAGSLDIEIAPAMTLEKEDLAKELSKREDILKKVKDMSLLHGTVRNLLEAHDEEAILKIILQGLQVLFDVKDTFFFLYDSERDMLVGRGIPGQPQHDLLNEVAIPLQNGKSILVKSLRRKEPIDSFSFHKKSSPTIIDEQIIRAMGQGGILCLPMLAHRQAVGVLVLGIDHARFSRLSNQARLLTLSTSQAALALHAHAIRRSQEKVVQAERLTASLEIARKVAHEVNSPLSIIKNYLKVLELKLPKKELAQEELKIITEEIDRIALIVRELSDFSEPVIERSETLDINALLTDVTRITKGSDLLHDNIHVHLNLEPFLPTIVSEKNSLKQIFINLLKNAGEAMPDGGNIHITTRHVSHKLLNKAQEDREEVSGSVEITISDDGPGLPETIKARLFEPFVSTKGEGHSGLGLSIVHSILKELGGTVRCSSDGRRGTSFKIILPVEKN
ncbi:MAG: ATP-binding protein, partial [Promethearchaeota archaeon]